MAGRVNSDAVTGVDTGSPHAQDTGDQDLVAVSHGVHFDFLSGQVLVDESGWPPDAAKASAAYAFSCSGVDNLHGLAAQDIRGPHQNRVTTLIGGSQGPVKEVAVAPAG